MASTAKGVAKTIVIAFAASTPVDPIDLFGVAEEQIGGYWIFNWGPNAIFLFQFGEAAVVSADDGIILPVNQWMYIPKPKTINTGAALPNNKDAEIPWTMRAQTADSTIVLIADRTGNTFHPA